MNKHYAQGYHFETSEFVETEVFTDNNEYGWVAWAYDMYTPTISCKDEYAAIRLLMNQNGYINVIVSNKP